MKLVMNAHTPIRDNIHTIIAAIDNHDAGILDGTYICPCKFQGTEHEWEQHVADVIDRQLAADAPLPQVAI